MFNASSFTLCRKAIAERDNQIVSFIQDILGNIYAQNEILRAFEHLDTPSAIKTAEYLDSLTQNQRSSLPLAGIPFAVKDIIDVKGMPTNFGCKAPIGYTATTEANIIKLLRAQGAIVLGKSVTTELAFLEPSATLNPRGHEFTPGGSSSGSAASVAANLLPLAIGTQTGGSIIRPAAFCGIFAIKPTFGLIDRFGILNQSPSLDTIGFMANDLQDLSQVMRLCTAACPPRYRNKTLRIGALQDDLIETADPCTLQLLTETSQKCKDLIFPISSPIPLEKCVQLRMLINNFELHHQFNCIVQAHQKNLSQHVLTAYADGGTVCTNQYFDALNKTTSLRAQFASLFEEFDALIMPASLGEPPKGLDSTGDPVFNGPWTLLGFPVVNLPVAKGPNGMPLCLQLIGSLNRDLELLENAKRLSIYLHLSE